MTTAATVTLDELASPDAHEILHVLRTDHPVSWVPAIDGWLVTGRSAAVAVLRDAETFTVDDERFTTAAVVGRSMLSTDGAEHRRHREPFAPPFARPSIDRRALVDPRTIADRIVSSLEPAGRAELRTELAGRLAVEVIVEALGLDAEPADVLAWYRSIVAGVNDLSRGKRVSAATEAAVATLRHVVDRASSGAAGILRNASGSLTGDEVFSNAAVIMFGAIETSEGMTANLLWHVLSTPELLASVTRDRNLLAGILEESLRLEPAASVVDRYATSDAALEGARIAAGDFVRVSLAGANRDPDVFDDPDRFVLDRPNAALQLAFVVGPHACLGLHLARAQTIAAVEAVLEILPGIAIGEASTPPTGLIFRKPQRLDARWGSVSAG